MVSQIYYLISFLFVDITFFQAHTPLDSKLGQSYDSSEIQSFRVATGQRNI